jgi:hypothetical protein
MQPKPLPQLIPAVLATLLPLSAQAYEVSDSFTIEAAVRGIGQYANYSNAIDDSGSSLNIKTKAAGLFDLALHFTPTENDELYAWLRFGSGNGLNDVGSAVEFAAGE